jgi:hypothetical protein
MVKLVSWKTYFTPNSLKCIRTYQAEIWPIKWKCRHKLLAAEIDYLWCLTRIPQMDRIRTETIEIKMRMEKNVLQEVEEQQLRWYGQVMQTEVCRIIKQAAEWNP